MCLRCSRGEEVSDDEFVETAWLGPLSYWTFARIPADISIQRGRLEVTRWEIGLVLAPPSAPSFSGARLGSPETPPSFAFPGAF